MTSCPAMDGPGHTSPAGDARWRQSVRRRLLAWYSRHARDLPWRRDPTLYRVWLSEVMLQQTQVSAVVPYFERFVARLPNIEALAAADEELVLRLWEGLGYYRRARQLHAAARRIMSRHGGGMPTDYDEWRALPGIGRYTAGAILSIALDRRYPAVEANCRRVLCRLVAYRGDPDGATGQSLLWELAERLLPRSRAGAFNQALMELGSQVCTPRSPACDACPLQALCETRKRGWQSRIPRPRRSKVFEVRREAAVIVRRNGRVLMRRCQAGERWAGLWDFPRFALERPAADVSREIADKTAALTGVVVQPRRLLATFNHGVTRYKIRLTCHQAELLGGRIRHPACRWVKIPELERLPLSASGRRLSGLLRK